MKKLSLTLAVLVSMSLTAMGQGLFSPDDDILGGQLVDGTFETGEAGFVIPGNNWPGGEAPNFAIDGVGQKYLNFGQENTGILVTPGTAGGAPKSIQFWAANDAVERDPAAFELWGTNSKLDDFFNDISDFTMIAGGDILLPESRNDGGEAALDPANAYAAAFLDNEASYASYLVLFPTVKDLDAANSMQIADVQIYSVDVASGGVVPEPSSAFMALSLGLLLPLLRKRR